MLYGKKMLQYGQMTNLRYLEKFITETQYVQEILDFLKEDCWKDFDIKYGIDNVLQKLKTEFKEIRK